MKKVLVTAAIALVGACSSMPSPDEISKADHGAYPDSYEKITKNYFERILKDPDSANYKSITTPQKYYAGSRFDGAKYGYLVCASVNSKNSYGGYTGYKTHGLLIRNNVVIQFFQDGRWWDKYVC